MNKSLMLLLLILLFSMSVFSAETIGGAGLVTGKVVNEATQSPLPGTIVKILGTDLGAYTNEEGKFRIENVPAGVYSLQFSFVGFKSYVQTDVVVTTGMPYSIEVELVEQSVEVEGATVKAKYFLKKSETVTSTQILNSESIRRAPGVQEDVIRAAALLPGVGVTQAGRNDLLVRGGAPFENLFIVDNIEVPNINHFGSQGSSGGPLSIVNLDFVRSVSFSAGGFGAKFGDKVSSITNIKLRNGSEEAFGGKVNLSATGFGLNLEGPIADKGSYLLSARRSYLDLIFKAAGFGFIPEYWDFHTKINYNIDESNSLTFLTIGALGTVTLNNEDEDKRLDNSRISVPKQDQYFSGFTWKHLIDNGYINTTLGQTYTKYTTYQNDSNLVQIFRNNSKEAETSLKIELDWMMMEHFELQVGNTVKYGTSMDYDILIPGNYRLDQFGTPQSFQVDTSFSTLKNATYASITTTIGNYKITAGGRLDYYDFLNDKLFFSPRLSMIYTINAVSNIVFSAGRYYQSPSYIWLIGGSNGSLKPIRADQVVLGYEHTPLEDVKVQLEVFYKIYGNYPARIYRPQAVLAPSGFDDLQSDIPYGLEPLSSTGEGFSRGVELFIQKNLSEIPLYGLLSVSVAETKFTSLLGGERYGAFDTRIIMNIALGYRFSQEWELSGKFRFATGLPTTPFLPNGRQDFTRYNEGPRLPDFNALDVRLDKRWDLGDFYLITYIDIQNIYGKENISAIKWNYRTMAEEYQSSLGILPSIGINFQF
jgi:hypothetical protein